jgi:hypothetical protein
MAQFDVHHNQGLQRDTMPFVVLVQSGKYDSYRGRVVVPLVRRSALSATTPTVGSRLEPGVERARPGAGIAPAGHGIGGTGSVGLVRWLAGQEDSGGAGHASAGGAIGSI